MKQSPNDYAEMIIEQYRKVEVIKNTDYQLTKYISIQCAINDVNNTIEALTELKFNYNYPTITYYIEVRNILKSKL
jgi:hypothetical protein